LLSSLQIQEFPFHLASAFIPTVCLAQPLILNVTEALLSGVNQPENETYHSTPRNAEFKDKSIHTPTHPLRLYGVHRDKFFSVITARVLQSLSHVLVYSISGWFCP